MKELQKFPNSTFDEFTRQKYIEDQKTIMELSERLQELQNEVNCMNDSKDFQDADSVHSGNSHVTRQPGVFPEVELVDSVDELRSSSSTRGISMPNFEVLDARIASALNKIIHNSHFKRRISLEEQKAQKEDRFFRGRQIAYLIYEQFRVTGTHDSVENYTDLFTIVLRNDDIQEFDSKWNGILLSMTKIPHDDILEGLYKLRIRESEKLKTVLELYDLETHQKKLGPDYHRLKAMVKRSIEQEIRKKNLAPEIEIMKETPWSRIRGQSSVDKEFLEIVGNGKPTGSALKETIAVSDTMPINVRT